MSRFDAYVPLAEDLVRAIKIVKPGAFVKVGA